MTEFGTGRLTALVRRNVRTHTAFFMRLIIARGACIFGAYMNITVTIALGKRLMAA